MNDRHHPDRDLLLGFAAGTAPPSAVDQIYQHLAECAACTERYQAIRVIRSDFEAAWGRFAGEAEGRRAPEGGAATTAGDAAPWLDFVILGVLDGARRLAGAAAGVAAVLRGDEPLQGIALPAYSGVGDPAVDSDSRRVMEEAAAACGRGAFDAALGKLAEAARLNPAASQTGRVQLRLRGRVVGEVIVDARRTSVSVLIDPEASGIAGGWVTLSRPDDPVDREAALEPVEGSPHLLAEFENLPDGSFMIRLHPAPGS